MMRGMRLAVYLPDLAGGGAERLQVNLAPAFVAAGLEVTFVLDEAKGELLPAVPPEARIVPLNAHRTIAAVPRLVRYLRRERPDVLVSSLGHSNIAALWAAAMAGTGTPVVVTQHSVLSAETRRRSLKYRVLPLLYRLFLGWADGVVAVSNGVAEDMAAATGFARDRITVIPNGVIAATFESEAAKPPPHPWLNDGGSPVLLGVGRLSHEKDFATLIAAFAEVTRRREARLVILGEGPLRAELRTLADAAGIGSLVDMPGYRRNPLPYMRHAAALVASSRYEGFGNTLAEALACGTPVVSTACLGPVEILANGRFGALTPVGDPDALAQAILDTLAVPPSPRTLRERGHEYTVQRACDRYLDLFATLIKGKAVAQPVA